MVDLAAWSMLSVSWGGLGRLRGVQCTVLKHYICCLGTWISYAKSQYLNFSLFRI